MEIEGQKVARFDFGDGKTRKLKARHRHIADAIRKSGKSMSELLADKWAGWPFLLVALLRDQWETAKETKNKPLTVDVASDLMDLYVMTHQEPGSQPLDDIGLQIMEAMSPYVVIEQTKPDDEESDAPNADTQATPGPSAG